jgi:hypothetical protein
MMRQWNEIRAGRLRIEGQRTAADIAEHERRAGPRRRRNRLDGAVDPAKRNRGLRDLQHQDREAERHGKPDNNRPPRHRAAVLADEPGDSEEGKDAERGLQTLH